jgi:hypothetical protein
MATRMPGLTVIVLSLAACASAPVHYYTLVPPASSGGTEAGNAHETVALPFELLPVNVPAQVDQPQLVVRRSGEGMVPLNGERWIAPLTNEVHAALALDLARRLGSPDVSGLADTGKPSLRIKVDLRRFESVPGQYALIESGWSIRVLHAAEDRSVACSSRVSETIGPGYDALVQGHQRALAKLSDQIAATARSLAGSAKPLCPPP